MGEVTIDQRRAELLRRHVTNCTLCSLHLYTSPTPPSIPAITPELLMIGEAPGATEERQQEPFVGAAGNLIFRLLKLELGLVRAQVLIANSVSCRPTVANKGKQNRAPAKDELWQCRDNLARVVDLYVARGGRWVLLLGATALQTFVEGARIGAWAGRPFVVKHGSGKLLDVVATFHPAAALRDDRVKPQIAGHLNLLAGWRKGGDWPEKCMCGADVELFDEMGIPWCEKHRGSRRGLVRAPARRMEQGKLVV